MAIKHGNKFKCLICGKEFSREVDCDVHRETEHDLVYLPLKREDLSRLYQFIFTKNPQILSESLVMTICKYAEESAKTQIISDK